MEAAKQGSLALLEDEAGKDATFKKVYEHWKSAKSDLDTWFSAAEKAYAQYALE